MSDADLNKTRVTRRFAAIRRRGTPGLVTFITANDPTPDVFRQILEGLPAAGADIIEVGMPFSDPMADGPSIQLSSQRALKHDASLKRLLATIAEFRDQEPDTPIILMGYYNPIYRYGPMEFAADAAAAGVDGMIVVDLPPEEAEELNVYLRANGLHMIFLTAPTSSDVRLPTILRHASGFVYYVSVAGVTGTKTADESAVRQAVARLRRHTKLPVAVGFGIRTPDAARAIAAHCDAAVVGSAIVDVIAAGLGPDGAPKPGLAADVLGFVKGLAGGVARAARDGAAPGAGPGS
ncbi:MAG: tryptophan synthase subunit alpha [Rhodospirillaceae bacterium]|nr:tryptophan synthase subunit alpha [Rhodospirillaceae bacterium]